MSSAIAPVNRVVAGKYAILRTIGVGGAATVYEAENLVVGKRVAIKLLDGWAGTADPRAAAFVAEARAAAHIGHPNIVDVLDVGFEQSGCPYLVMELCRGDTLRELLDRRGPFPVPYACEIVLQILSAVSAAHERGIVHCDLKPSNVVVTQPSRRHPRVKVLDFGIAQGLIGRAASGAGTPLYMPPEQALGQDVDERVDVYAAAAILYELLAGTPAFEAESFEHVIAAKVSGRFTDLERMNPAVPEELARAVADALAGNREQRPASAWSLRAASRPTWSQRRRLIPRFPSRSAAGSVGACRRCPRRSRGVPVGFPAPYAPTAGASPSC